MREILFRGKRLDNGEWVEGFYTCFNNKEHRIYTGYAEKEHRIYTGYAETDCGDYYPDWWAVDPETVGQYTGLEDKNGRRIFEGDIVDHHAQGNIIVNRGVVKWDEKNGRWAHRLNTMEPAFSLFNPAAWEVIGNICDNPELLKGGMEA